MTVSKRCVANCAEEVLQHPRATERRSPSAPQAAQPQAIADRIKRNLDKPV